MLTDNCLKTLQESFEKLPVWGGLIDGLSIKNAKESIRNSFRTLAVPNSEALVGNDKFVSILTSYLMLTVCVRRLISRMSNNKDEDDANLSKLSVVEIESRALLLKAHIARLVEEFGGDEFTRLLTEGETALFTFLPEVAAFQSKLLINGTREIDAPFAQEVVFQQNLVSSLIRDTIS